MLCLDFRAQCGYEFQAYGLRLKLSEQNQETRLMKISAHSGNLALRSVTATPSRSFGTGMGVTSASHDRVNPNLCLDAHGTWQLLLTGLTTLPMTPLNGLRGVTQLISRCTRQLLIPMNPKP